MMRTTLDLPDDVHAAITAIARDRSESMGQVVAALVRVALGTGHRVEVDTDDATGLPVVHLGRTVTAEDVRALEDEL